LNRFFYLSCLRRVNPHDDEIAEIDPASFASPEEDLLTTASLIFSKIQPDINYQLSV